MSAFCKCTNFQLGDYLEEVGCVFYPNSDDMEDARDMDLDKKRTQLKVFKLFHSYFLFSELGNSTRRSHT